MIYSELNLGTHSLGLLGIAGRFQNEPHSWGETNLYIQKRET